MVSHHSAMFGGYKHCDSRDVTYICHVTSRDDVIKGSCNSLFHVTALPNLVAINLVVLEI